MTAFAWNMGFDAAMRGQQIGLNPFAPGSQWYVEWENGFCVGAISEQ